MSKLFIHFLNDAQIAALKDAGHQVQEEAVTAGQHAVAIIKASPVGEQIVQMIHTVADKNMSGLEKGAAVVAEALPLVTSFVTGGGASIVASLADTTREVVQSLYNDTLGAVAHAATTAQAAPAAA